MGKVGASCVILILRPGRRSCYSTVIGAPAIHLTCSTLPLPALQDLCVGAENCLTSGCDCPSNKPECAPLGSLKALEGTCRVSGLAVVSWMGC